MVRALVLLLFVAGVVSGGCAPRLSPPYRDFEARPPVADSVLPDRLVAAAEAAGWEVVPARTDGVVSTAPRQVAEGFTSRTDAALDLVSLDGDFVRVYVRAERRSWLGGRSKVYALSPSLRAAVLGPITDALSAFGLVALDAPRDRDEDATE